jgi:AcrR family transcriptional regulator
MATRKYEQRLRAEAADETRERILDAVHDRLREAPAEPVSVDRIAKMAGVARSTVYLIFGSRTGLFDAFGERLFDRAGFERLAQAATQADARDNIRDGTRTATRMFAADRDVFRAMYAMSQLDKEAVGSAVERWEERRMTGMRRIAGELAEQGHLRPGVTADHAANVLWVLTSFESFDLLYTGRGLSVDKAADALIEMKERALLADAS